MAQPVQVDGVDVQEIKIRTSGSVCGWYIRGQVVGPNSEPLAGMSIRHCDIAMNRCFLPHSTALDGSFAISITASGSYRLRLDLVDGCSVYYRTSRVAIDRDEATPITIVDGHVRGLLLRVLNGMCLYQTRGSVRQADGQPLADTRVSACLEVDGDCVFRTGRNTDDHGAFAIIAPAEGDYRLSFNLEGCTVYFSSDGLSTAHGERSTMRVEGHSVRLNPRQIPEGMCALRISGRFVHSDGAPLSGEWLNVCNAGECRGFRTDENGEFAIRVPADGSYNFLAQLQSEPSCWHHLDGEALGSRNNPVSVSDADVTGVVLRLPGTIEELCG